MDWIRFLDENNIHYVTRGPNTKKGEVSIQCPMCGEADPSEHLGINLKTGYWGCHRDASHRGKQAHSLIRAVLGASTHTAKQIMARYDRADPDTLDAMLSALEGNEPETDVKQMLNHEAEWQKFQKIKARGLTDRYFRYLQVRGYAAEVIVRKYDLRCTYTGRYKDRILIPVRFNGELLGWTSRALGAPKSAPRYLMSDENVKTTVFNYDEVKQGGERLFIVEGPFDAIRIDSHPFTPRTDIPYRATCTFGTSPTISQIALLRTLVKKYTQAWVLFDEGADTPSRNLAEWIGAQSAYLPTGIKDPGDMTDKHLDDMADEDFDGYVMGGGNLHRYIARAMRNHSAKIIKSTMQASTLLKKFKSIP